MENISRFPTENLRGTNTRLKRAVKQKKIQAKHIKSPKFPKKTAIYPQAGNTQAVNDVIVNGLSRL
jgi:hypothetical protein